MVNICPECGEKFIVLYPQLWVYKREMLLCSWHCLRKHDKEKENMRMKKDGTPAKKPGRKAKENIISEVDIVSSVNADKPDENESPKLLDVWALKSRVLKSGRFEVVACNAMKLVYEPVNQNELLLKKESWLDFAEEILTALDQLGIKE